MQWYSLLFKTEDKVIEIGGGDHPLYRPNVDIRPGPAVDIVADMNEPLPIESESYDGIFSQFLLEHLRLPRVRPFLSEMHRILKPGGRALIITANLLEQAKILIEKEETADWNDDLIHMVFGGAPDYPENYHRSSLSPIYANQLFKEAGFTEVNIFKHPEAIQIWGKSTDMIVEAKKSLVRIKHQL